MNVFIRVIIFKFFWFGFTLLLSAQTFQRNKSLQNYLQRKNTEFNLSHNSAIEYFKQFDILGDTLLDSYFPKRLIYFANGTPLYFHSHNLAEGTITGINSFYPISDWHCNILGQHQLVGIWDAGHIFDQHIEFVDDNISRIIIDENINYKNHATHVGGTIAAKGENSEAKGMAPESRLYSADYINDIVEVGLAFDEQNIILSNHSYGPVSGWNYNTDEEVWYWYGSIGIDVFEDYKFGFYGDISANIDELCALLPTYKMIVSAGNDLCEGPEYQPVTHKVWEGKWKNSNVIRDIDGGEDGYDCLGMNGVAKNVITVGSVVTEEDDFYVSSFSSYGPTDDGRIKPDVVAPGVNVFSCIATDESSYGYYSGTSMSAAVVSGGIALLDELQYQFQPGVELLSSTIKGLLIHSATNISETKGPNYKTGWGMVDFDKAHQLLEDNILSGGEVITEASVLKGNIFSKSISVNEGEEIKVTLVWTDLPGEVGDAELDNSSSKLVNDLDLYIKKDGEVFYPFILDPDSPSSPAITGINLLDNVEQVIIANCELGEYQICVDASKIVSDNQLFSLIVSGHNYEIGFLPPTNLNGFYDPYGIKVYWSPPQKTIADKYEIYCNSIYRATTEDTFYTDDSYTLYDDLVYEVKAVYEDNSTKKSTYSNGISIKGLPIYRIPYLEDFELENSDWQYLNTELGWRYGDYLLLSSTYLDFTGNDTWFMGINSDNMGDDIHITDLLISPPIDISNDDVITIECRYYLNNSVYNTNDLLSLYYRTSINQEWIFLSELSSAESWTLVSESLQKDENMDVIQLAFLFDDNDEWGNGAGVDDFYFQESNTNYIEYISTEFKCFWFNGVIYFENLKVESEYACWYVVNVAGKQISEGKTYIGSGSTSFDLNVLNQGIYFIVLQTSKGNIIKKVPVDQ